MVERIKNKKGFTIIEIMVVIALIGILAAVLVPQFSGVKDTARNTGVMTNAKVVEAYIASVIDDYPDGSAIGTTAGTGDLIAAIESHFNTNQLTNPYTGVTAATNVAVVETSGTTYRSVAVDVDDAGLIYVVLNDTNTAAYINGYDASGKELKNARRTVER